MKEDRFIAGSIAGLMGSVVCDILGFISKSFSWSDRAYYDYAQILIGGEIYTQPVFGPLMALIAHSVLSAFLGAIFAYLITLTSSTYLMIKGLMFGTAIWLIFNSTGVIFHLPLFEKIPINVAYTMFVTALAYGVTVSLTLNFIKQKSNLI